MESEIVQSRISYGPQARILLTALCFAITMVGKIWMMTRPIEKSIFISLLLGCFGAAWGQTARTIKPSQQLLEHHPIILSPVDRSLLTEYNILGREDIPLVIAAEPTQTRTVAEAIESADGHILSRQDEIGFLYVLVPLKGLKDIIEISGIDALQVACNPVRSDAREPLDKEEAKKKGIPPSPFLPAENPYTGERATQSAAFKAAHPTFDGRGVVIAFTEHSDPVTPSMQGALDPDGVPLPKFRMYSWGSPDLLGNVEEIEDLRHYFYWQRTTAVLPDASGHFSFEGHYYKLPDGVMAKEWRLCLRRQPDLWALMDKPPARTPYVVLWAVDQHQLWMMDEGRKDFGEAHTAQVAEPWFLVHIQDFAPGAERQTPDWVFNVDVDRRLLGFGPTTVRHGAMVASVMAGKSFLGSKAGGVAPAAQLAMFSQAWMAKSPGLDDINSLFRAAQDPATDIIQSSVFVGDSWRSRGDGAFPQLAARLSRVTGKPFVEAAGNAGTERNTISGFGAADEVFTVGGFTPRETLRVNFGYELLEDFPIEYSNYGPTADGGLKPDFLALTGTLSESEYGSGYWDSPFGLYSPSGGTSAASPNAAGLLALLVSAAKQIGVKYDVARLRAALTTAARFLPGVESRAQGHGLIQVSDAWTALQRANRWEPSRFVTRASVVNAEGVTERTDGRGLLELSGWTPGLTGHRNLTVTRIEGPADASTYRLKWKGSTEVFSSPIREVTLPLNQPVSISIDINAAEVGSYSAILDFIDPRVDLIAHSVMTTIFVASPLTSTNNYNVTLVKSSTHPRSLIYVNVPAGLSGLMVHLKREDGKQSGLKSQDPTGRILPYKLYGSVLWSNPDPVSAAKGEQIQFFDHPAPGVWQFTVNMDGVGVTREGANNPHEMKFSIQCTGYRVDPISNGTERRARNQTVTFENKTATEVKAHAVGVGLGSEREVSLLLKPGLTASLFQIHVAEGTTRLEIAFEYGDPTSWVGLYVYKAPNTSNGAFGDPKALGDATALIYEDSSHATQKHWVLESPSPGQYVIAVDPLHAPPSGVTLHYRDVLIAPVFGEVNCSSSGDAIAPMGKMSARLSWTARALPVDGRKLVGECSLVSPGVGNSKIVDGQGHPEQNKLEIVPATLASQTILVSP